MECEICMPNKYYIIFLLYSLQGKEIQGSAFSLKPVNQLSVALGKTEKDT